jgi:hypothetical protein
MYEDEDDADVWKKDDVESSSIAGPNITIDKLKSHYCD